VVCKILLEEFARRKLSLDKVVLFGSYAKGNYQIDSDIDLIIISRDFRGKDLFERVKLASGINRQLVYQTGKPFDLLYYSDQEWREGSSLMVSLAKQEGEVIYG